MFGLDRSRNLLQIARHAGSQSAVDPDSIQATVNEVIQADVLDRCWRTGVFVRFSTFPGLPVLIEFTQDYAISIATIHHLVTGERRKVAVQVLSIALRHYCPLTTPPEVNSSYFSGSWTSAHIRVGDRAG